MRNHRYRFQYLISWSTVNIAITTMSEHSRPLQRCQGASASSEARSQHVSQT